MATLNTFALCFDHKKLIYQHGNQNNSTIFPNLEDSYLIKLEKLDPRNAKGLKMANNSKKLLKSQNLSI